MAALLHSLQKALLGAAWASAHTVQPVPTNECSVAQHHLARTSLTGAAGCAFCSPPSHLLPPPPSLHPQLDQPKIYAPNALPMYREDMPGKPLPKKRRKELEEERNKFQPQKGSAARGEQPPRVPRAAFRLPCWAYPDSRSMGRGMSVRSARPTHAGWPLRAGVRYQPGTFLRLLFRKSMLRHVSPLPCCPLPRGAGVAVGAGGQLGASGGTLLTQHVLKQQGGLLNPKDEDARAMFLRHADKAADEFERFTAAYRATQPQRIYQEEEEEEEGGEGGGGGGQ